MKSSANAKMINGIEYGWASIKVLINNTLLTSITAISYSETATIENLYGLGNQPVARGIGNYEYDGSITIRKSELLALQTAARVAGDPDGSISSLMPFTAIISYERLGGGGIATDVLSYVQFGAVANDSAQDDTSIDITIPLIIGYITWNKQ